MKYAPLTSVRVSEMNISDKKKLVTELLEKLNCNDIDATLKLLTMVVAEYMQRDGVNGFDVFAGKLKVSVDLYSHAAYPEQTANKDETSMVTVLPAALLQGKAVLPDEKDASLQLRNLIRQRHAEWSEKTFGNVGPVGPLKHLSKEAPEAAAEPDDLSEWADMQFLLWDAQRRAGISDGEITAAMEEKLKVNMARQWPEPKDGEPRLHIKEAINSPVIPDGYVMVPIEPTEIMIVDGFESEPDEDFSEPEEWEAYEAMSGCQQAAHRAKLCWAAMIKAAPKQEAL